MWTIDDLVQLLFRGVDRPGDGGRNAVRTLLHRVRLELRRYFEAQYRGHAAPYTIDIRWWREIVRLTLSCRAQKEADFMTILSGSGRWACWREKSRSSRLAPEFFLRIGDNLFIRDVHVQQGGDIDEILRQLGIDPTQLTEDQRSRIKRTRHFVSAGETAGMLHLADGFLTRGRIIRFGNLPRYGKSRCYANLIQVGLPRMDDLRVYTMIQGERFYLVPAALADRNASQQPFYCDEEFRATGDDPFDSTVEEADRFAIVTRIPNCDPNYSVTAITSNHGRATEAVCQYLSDST